MTFLTLYFHGELYRVHYDEETKDIHEVVWFPDGRTAALVEFEELEDELKVKIEKAVES